MQHRTGPGSDGPPTLRSCVEPSALLPPLPAPAAPAPRQNRVEGYASAATWQSTTADRPRPPASAVARATLGCWCVVASTDPAGLPFAPTAPPLLASAPSPSMTCSSSSTPMATDARRTAGEAPTAGAVSGGGYWTGAPWTVSALRGVRATAGTLHRLLASVVGQPKRHPTRAAVAPPNLSGDGLRVLARAS